MRLLRISLVVYACVCIIGGIILLQQAKEGWNLLIAGYLLVNSMIIIVGILFERNRYKSNSLPKTGWQYTGERFIDQSTGKVIEVLYHPKTGKRNYVSKNEPKRKHT